MELSYNLKIVETLNSIEIYYYSKPIVLGITRNKDGKGNKTDKKIVKKISLHRTKTTITRLINSNEWNYFLTLTYADDVSIEDSKIDLQNFIKKLRQMYYEFQYLYVLELTKRGRPHYHLLLNIDIGIIDDMKAYERFFAKVIWKHGFIKLKPIDSNDGSVGGYLVKYLNKDFDIDTKCRLWGHSRGLNNPVENLSFTTTDIYKLLEEMNIDIKYISSYTQEYNHKGNEIVNRIIYVNGGIKE